MINDNPGKTHKEIMSIVGTEWKKLTPDEKKVYVEMSKNDIADR